MLLRPIIAVLVLGLAACELSQFIGDFSYGYARTISYERHGMSQQAVEYTIDLPFEVMMHGVICKQVIVSTDGFLLFKGTSASKADFQIQVGSSPGNALTDLMVYSTDKNLTIEYVGMNINNGMSNHFYVTFFKRGFEQFMVQVASNSSGNHKLCDLTNICYQGIDTSTRLYSQCGSSKCHTYYKKCTDEAQCRSTYPDCYQEGIADCMNEISFTTAMTVIASLFSGISLIVNLIRCLPALARCCGCRDCQCSCPRVGRCCCCPEPTVPPVIDVGVIPAPDALRLSILQRGQQLTELHHPIALEELQRMACPICMEPGINTMTVCEHHFHWDCLQLWLTRKNECPYCRHHLTRVFYQSCRDCRRFVLPVRNDNPTLPRSCTACTAKPPRFQQSEQMIRQ